jgi:hypothetical protein
MKREIRMLGSGGRYMWYRGNTWRREGEGRSFGKE